MDVELTVVEKREYRARDPRREGLTPKDGCMAAVRGSSAGIRGKKVTIMSLLSLFSLNWFETHTPDCTEGKSQQSALPEDTGDGSWSGELPPGV